VPAGGLYAVLALALAGIAFAAPTLLGGSGFLAVYVAGLVIGNSNFPYRAGLLRFHDAIAWVAQVGMFLMLGLLVFPHDLAPVALAGVTAALLLSFVVRPLAVALCLAPFRYPRKEVAFVGWVGLRGAVPIVLATFPVMAGVPGADSLFNLVFFVVVVSAILPGATVGWVTRRLNMTANLPPPPPAVLEITSLRPLGGDIMSFHVDPSLAVCGARLRELPLPEGALVMLILRGDELLAPRGSTQLLAGDRAFVFARSEDRPLVELLFGSGE
jgi:potassium/hydrogen antiporter